MSDAAYAKLRDRIRSQVAALLGDVMTRIDSSAVLPEPARHGHSKSPVSLWSSYEVIG
jgi:hypothetical protein